MYDVWKDILSFPDFNLALSFLRKLRGKAKKLGEVSVFDIAMDARQTVDHSWDSYGWTKDQILAIQKPTKLKWPTFVNGKKCTHAICLPNPKLLNTNPNPPEKKRPTDTKKVKKGVSMNKSEGYLEYIAEECAKKILSFDNADDMDRFLIGLMQKAKESHFVTLEDASVLRDAVIEGSREEVVQAMEMYGWESNDILVYGEVMHSSTPKGRWTLLLPPIKKFHRGYSNKNNTDETPKFLVSAKKVEEGDCMNKSEGYLKHAAEECAKALLTFNSYSALNDFVSNIMEQAKTRRFITISDASVAKKCNCVFKDALVLGRTNVIAQAIEMYGWESRDILLHAEVMCLFEPEKHWVLIFPPIQKIHGGLDSKVNVATESPKNHNTYGISMNKDVSSEGKPSYSVYINSSNLEFLNRILDIALEKAREFSDREEGHKP